MSKRLAEAVRTVDIRRDAAISSFHVSLGVVGPRHCDNFVVCKGSSE